MPPTVQERFDPMQTVGSGLDSPARVLTSRSGNEAERPLTSQDEHRLAAHPLTSSLSEEYFDSSTDKKAATGWRALSLWPHRSVTDHVGPELAKELIIGNSKEITHTVPADLSPDGFQEVGKQLNSASLTQSDPRGLANKAQRLGMLPETPTITSTASHRSQAIDRLASAVMRSYESAFSGDILVEESSEDEDSTSDYVMAVNPGELFGETEAQDLTRQSSRSDPSGETSDAALQCRTFNLSEAMELIDSNTTSMENSSTDIIQGFMDDGRTGVQDAEVVEARSPERSPLRSPAKGAQPPQLGGSIAKSGSEPLLYTPRRQERLDTDASLASLRRAADDVLETPRNCKKAFGNPEDTSGLRTPAFCTPSPSPFREIYTSDTEDGGGDAASASSETPGSGYKVCGGTHFVFSDSASGASEQPDSLHAGQAAGSRPSAEVATKQRPESHIQAKDPNAIISLSYLVDNNQLQNPRREEDTDAASAARTSGSSFVFPPSDVAKDERLMGPSLVIPETGQAASSNKRRPKKAAGGRTSKAGVATTEGVEHKNGKIRGSKTAEIQPLASSTAETASLPLDLKHEANTGRDGAVPKQRSLLGRIGAKAWRAVRRSKHNGAQSPPAPALDPRVTDLLDARQQPEPTLSHTPASIDHPTPRASYTVTIQDWPGPEGSPEAHKESDEGFLHRISHSSVSRPGVRRSVRFADTFPSGCPPVMPLSQDLVPPESLVKVSPGPQRDRALDQQVLGIRDIPHAENLQNPTQQEKLAPITLRRVALPDSPTQSTLMESDKASRRPESRPRHTSRSPVDSPPRHRRSQRLKDLPELPSNLERVPFEAISDGEEHVFRGGRRRRDTGGSGRLSEQLSQWERRLQGARSVPAPRPTSVEHLVGSKSPRHEQLRPLHFGARADESPTTPINKIEAMKGFREFPEGMQSEIQPEAGPSPGSPDAEGPLTPDPQQEVQSRFKALKTGDSVPAKIGKEVIPPTHGAESAHMVSLDSGDSHKPASLGVIIMEESGNRYEGQVGSSGLDGLGVLLFEGGGSYAGKWGNSVYEGAGIETFSNGSHYVGHFHHGKQHGNGVCYYVDGTTYAGEWQSGVQEGLGSQDCEHEDGFFYVGNYVEGARLTLGALQDCEHEDGFFYVGNYVEGARHGLGVAGFANGEEFSGELECDAPHGYGVAHLGPAKGTYEGQWMSGLRHGWAVSTLSNGTMWAGQWIFGKACWLAQLKAADDGELTDQYVEAMDLCEEAARLARAAGMSAMAQAQSVRVPGGQIQVAIHNATREGIAAAREAHMQRQKAQLACHAPPQLKTA